MDLKSTKFRKNIILYVIILSIGMLLSSCFFDNTTKEDNNSLDETVEEDNNSLDETIEEDNNSLDEITVEEYLELKELSYESEGMKYTETFKLVNVPDIPFITYIPEKDWSVKTKENSICLEQKKYGNIEVVFLDKSINKQDAELIVEEVVADKKLIKRDKKLPPWAIAFYSTNSTTESYYLMFGEYENQFFYIDRYLSLEGGEVFVPVEQVIYREWIWKNADKPTDMMFFNWIFGK